MSEPIRREDVASPFCGIASDDLTIEVSGLEVKVVSNGDAVTQRGFETPITDTQPRVNGKEVDLAIAVAKAADLLRASSQSVISGLATDVNGARAVMALADKSRAVIDHYASAATFRNLLVLQDTGWMTTTLGEVKNRVDLLVVVGSDIESRFPRFFERCMWNEESLFEQDIASREIVFLGKAPSGDASTSPAGKQAEVMACDSVDLPEVVSVLRALVAGRTLQASQVGGIDVAALSKLAARLKVAKYSVVTWAAGELDFKGAEATVQTVCEMIKDLNKDTRSSGLPLGGIGGETTANQVSAWQAGYPMRTSFGLGYPDYDPYLYDSERMLAAGEVETLLWVSSFDADVVPTEGARDTIVLGRSGMQFSSEPAVFIPIGTPGIDHAGQVFRTDGVVALPVQKLRDSGLPNVADVLAAIEEEL
jgi:formylmethanofuran dehydrogenase subunit B